MSRKFEPISSCPECNCTKIIYDHERAESVCSSCGIVLSDTVFADGAESVEYTKEGATKTTYTHGLGSKISKIDVAKLSHNRAKYSKLRVRQKWESEGIDRALAKATSKLETVAARNEIPAGVVEYAKQIYRGAARKKLVKGRSVDNVLAAGTYIGYKKIGYVRSFDEVSSIWNVTKKDLGRDFRMLNRQLHLRLANSSPDSYVEPMASKLKLSADCARQAKKLAAKSAHCQHFSGKSPKCIAAAAIYNVAKWNNIKLAQTEIAESTGVSCPTIKRLSEDLERNFGNIGFC